MARFYLPVLVTVLMLAGCSSPTTVDVPISEQNLRKIGAAYREHSEKKGPPASAKDLLPHLKDEGGEAVFKSENDGEEFVIHWGVDLKALAGKETPVIAYEKTGRRGTRLVLRGYQLFHMTDEEFQKAPFPQGAKRP